MRENPTGTGHQRKAGSSRAYEKWGIDVVKGGYTLIPRDLMEINLYLADDQKLTPTELMVLFVIISTWSDPKYFPSASRSFIANRLNISERQVQRIVARLIEKQVLRRYQGTGRTGYANEYWLTGILDAIRKIRTYKETGDFGSNEHQFAFSFEESVKNDPPF
jgi:hypothetical protein